MGQSHVGVFGRLRKNGFDVMALQHAEAILLHDMPQAVVDIEAVLSDIQIPIEELVSGGGGEAPSTQRMRRQLTDFGWLKRNITITKSVSDGNRERTTQSLSHEIDHVKSFGEHVFALEIEWNNKDPFFDRDLDSFKRLHAEGAISIGGIITRGRSFYHNIPMLLKQFADRQDINCFNDLKLYGYAPTVRQSDMIEQRQQARGDSFRQAWVDLFVSDKFGASTTHWGKLQDRVERGVGNPCPLVLIGIPSNVVKL